MAAVISFIADLAATLSTLELDDTVVKRHVSPKVDRGSESLATERTAIAVSPPVAILMLLQTRTCGEQLRAHTAAVAMLIGGVWGHQEGLVMAEQWHIWPPMMPDHASQADKNKCCIVCDSCR